MPARSAPHTPPGEDSLGAPYPGQRLHPHQPVQNAPFRAHPHEPARRSTCRAYRRHCARSPWPSLSLRVTLTIRGLTPTSDEPRDERSVGIAGRRCQVRGAAGHATSSIASHGAVATVVGVTPAIALISVEVGLVGVAALSGNARGGVTRREKVGGVVEAHQLRGAFGGEADLGPEAGPQALAAPADLVRQAVDPYPPSAGDRPPPGVSDLRIDRWALVQSPAEDVRCDREPFVPRRGSAQPVLDLPGVADPDIFQGCDGPGELDRCAEHRSRDDRRQPDLEALPPPSACPKLAREESGDEAAALVPPARGSGREAGQQGPEDERLRKERIETRAGADQRECPHQVGALFGERGCNCAVASTPAADSRSGWGAPCCPRPVDARRGSNSRRRVAHLKLRTTSNSSISSGSQPIHTMSKIRISCASSSR